jgi:putative ABC transport system permease protein
MARRRLLLREPMAVALEALRAHKLRSFLTLLGVIISVTTLIGVISIVEGLNQYVAERLANFGTNVFYVTRWPLITNAKDYLEALRRNRKMSVEDYHYLREHITLAAAVGAQDWRDMDVRAGNQSIEDVSLRGTTPNMIDISTEKVAAGRYITEMDYGRSALVGFIGTDLRDRFFPQVDPLGKTLSIDGIPFEVVGVAEPVGSVFGQSQDNFIYVPLTTLHKVWGEGPANEMGPWVGIKSGSPAVMTRAMDQARALMRLRRRLAFEEPDRFGIIQSESVTGLWNQITGGLASLTIGMVSVFLVVGGIVIMNIMLASVTERTREIGIRKSLGARRRDILMQFVVEASVMSVAGGLVGVLAAVAITGLVTALTPVPARTPLGAILLAVGVAAAVGLFFGIYPAMKAARLDPVVALRAE